LQSRVSGETGAAADTGAHTEADIVE
jgi:hypothetical protein